MFLLTVSTKDEIANLLPFIQSTPGLTYLITGVGILESALNLSKYLCSHSGQSIEKIINFGVGGAFVGSGLSTLDICLAEQEILADYGICFPDKIAPFRAMSKSFKFSMNNELLSLAKKILKRHDIPFSCGSFATVNGASGTAARGAMLKKQYDVICENMEGAAITRVCHEFNIPCLEIRSISNMIENRDTAEWQLNESIEKGLHVLKKLLVDLLQKEKCE